MAITRIKGSLIENGSIEADDLEASLAALVSTGGGPKIANIQIANSAYSVLDDTAIALEGGYLVITGTGFASGCQVIVDFNTATSTTFVNSTTLRAQVGAAAAGSKVVYVVNTDGGTAIRVNGLTYSATPSWVTGSTLASGIMDTAISIQLNATADSNVVYQLLAGSTLPAGLTLSANGLLSGTVTGIESETTYTFTIEAIDAENQESPRTFSLTIIVALLVDYLVIAGGGGGGGVGGGGGGAGGYRESYLQLTGATNYTVTVGAAGSGGIGTNIGTSGSISTFVSITSAGGGGGGRHAAIAGLSGGSGGGGGKDGGAGGSGNTPSTIPSQGNNGGTSLGGVAYAGGGGGGAGAVGGSGLANEVAGNGGNGSNSSITGTETTYAGGGGGGTNASQSTNKHGLGGSGGGGNAGANDLAAQNGQTNKGGGGGAGGFTGSTTGGAGGSGVVILKYTNTKTISNPGGGLTFTTSTAVAGFKITTFTAGTGNIQFN